MEIIKEGDLNLVKKPRYFICKYCTCEFIADGTEYDYWGSHYLSTCPTCGASVYVEEEK